MNKVTGIEISLTPPDIIKKWSHGEVMKPETINYRTGRSERGGLFDERIFGPEKDYQCYCGKYKGIRYKGIVCEKCGVEVTRSVVRRERMGHIELASPVSHIWMLRGIPSRMSLLLDVPVSKLEKVIYFAGYIVTQIDENQRSKILKELDTEYKAKMKTLESEEDQDKLDVLFKETRSQINGVKLYAVLNEVEYHMFSKKYSTLFEAGIGAEAIFEIFKGLDLAKNLEDLEKLYEKSTKLQRVKVEKRLNLVRSMMKSNTRPEWMFLTVLPVIPPALRPMVGLDGGRYATSDINDLYRRVINRNNRLKKLNALGVAPEVILRNEKRILQEAVDALIDNSISKGSGGGAAMSQAQRRQLKSLSDNLKGKQGLFRSNLLGKRVDYSGRSVIVVGPRLKINQCGLPKFMALELFKPFVMAEMIDREIAFNVRGATRLIEERIPEVWEILDEVIAGKYVLLNRAPTLHRLSIQAFNPVLIEGKAIQLHPLVCPAFNADFDGDQMAVHLPLSEAAQREARELMAANKNLLKPQTGDPITTPAFDIVFGCYWMTKMVEGAKGEGNVYGSINEAITAYEHDVIDLNAKIKVKGSEKEKYAAFDGGLFDTTVGRLRLNSIFPHDFAFVNEITKKGTLKAIVKKLIYTYGEDLTAPMLDKIKELGFHYSTISGTTFGMDEAKVPEGKKAEIEKAEKKIEEINEQFGEGLLSEQERYRMTIEAWSEATHEVQELVGEELKKNLSLDTIVGSKARGNMSQLNQMSGMKGVIVSAKGFELDFPIISCYKEGFTPLEHFFDTTTARKGLADTALNTAKAGYLTRRLHDVAQDLVIREEDCGTKRGLIAAAENIDGIERSFADNLVGRVLGEKVTGENGETFKRNTVVDKALAAEIEATGAKTALVRSPMTCDSITGLCRQCYGVDLGRRGLVKLGEAVGTVASQAIGEPGTQLTLRTFHSGGVKGRDITQGLPRVEELFERRSPKVPAVIAPQDAMVTDIRKVEGVMTIDLTGEAQGDGEKASLTASFDIDPRRSIIVKKGDVVRKGEPVTDGSIDPQQLYDTAGQEITEHYLITEISKVYELHGTGVDRKHLELIVRQMFSRMKVTDPGDSLFTTGQIIEKGQMIEENILLEADGKMPVTGKAQLQGITNVALSAKSWLAAASFQHTNRVLISAAVKGTNDKLRGLKENVIVGGLIPAGTGFTDDFIDMTGVAQYEDKGEKEGKFVAGK